MPWRFRSSFLLHITAPNSEDKHKGGILREIFKNFSADCKHRMGKKEQETPVSKDWDVETDGDL